MLRTQAELQSIRASVELAGRLSDNLIHVGPFRIGIDGVLSWIPGVGEVYSALAGGFIVLQGFRAGVPLAVLAAAAALLVFRTAISAIPIAGAAASDLFTAHRWAARMIIHAIDQQLAGGAATGPMAFSAARS